MFSRISWSYHRNYILTRIQRSDYSIRFGYLALAALIFGKYNPITITLASLFFGGTKVFAEKVSILAPDLPIPVSFWNMFPFVATIIALIVFSKKTATPEALGIPYDKGLR